MGTEPELALSPEPPWIGRVPSASLLRKSSPETQEAGGFLSPRGPPPITSHTQQQQMGARMQGDHRHTWQSLVSER